MFESQMLYPYIKYFVKKHTRFWQKGKATEIYRVIWYSTVHFIPQDMRASKVTQFAIILWANHDVTRFHIQM